MTYHTAESSHVRKILGVKTHIQMNEWRILTWPEEMSIQQLMLKDAIRQAGLNEQAKGVIEKPELLHLLSNYKLGRDN
jgi:hypothetical protein